MAVSAYMAMMAASAGLTLASPLILPRENYTAPIPKMGFTVNQKAVGQTERIHPAVALLNTYNKYASAGAVAPANVKAAAAAQQSGTVAATPVAYDVEYLCAVTVGSNTLNLDFDTGSSDLWVYSNLQSSSQQSGHDIYTPSGSAMSGETWSIQYGDGSGASGVVYADKVAVGAVTATSQAVEAATSVSSSFQSDTNSDGLLGLGMSSINTVRPDQQKTFFDNVKSSLALPLFTATLKKGAAGSYDFGYIDSSKYGGSITYVDTDTSSGYWKFTADGYAIGDSDAVDSSFSTIADTGTTLLYLPSDTVTAYYNQVTGSSYSSSVGGYIFPCSSTLPDFTAIIGGSECTVPGTYMNYAQISSTSCFGGIQSNSGIGFSIFGDIFLKSQFVVFSKVKSTPQLGFAAQADLYDGDDC